MLHITVTTSYYVYVGLHCVVGHDVGVVSAGIVVIYVISTIDQYYT